MRKFILKRLAISVVILFFVALIIYTIMRACHLLLLRIWQEKASLPGGKSIQSGWIN